MRRTLAAALLIGRYSRAAQLFEQAGSAYRRYLGAADPWALDCAYQAGHAYAQAGKPDRARATEKMAGAADMPPRSPEPAPGPPGVQMKPEVVAHRSPSGGWASARIRTSHDRSATGSPVSNRAPVSTSSSGHGAAAWMAVQDQLWRK